MIKHWLAPAALVLHLGQALAAPALAPAQDLAEEARQSARQGMPLVILYTRQDCRYCTGVKRDYLQPLASHPDYRQRLVIREIDQGSNSPLRDFQGKATTHAEFARREKIRLVPVVAFYGVAGEALAQPIIGARLPDFYQSDLENALNEGRSNLAKTNAPRPQNVKP